MSTKESTQLSLISPQNPQLPTTIHNSKNLYSNYFHEKPGPKIIYFNPKK
jgi:hypothetical protein